MILEEVLQRFQRVRKSGRDYSAQCSSHEDKRNSLSIGEEDGKILIKCHAGCPTESVLSTAGLKLNDLFTDNGNGRPHDPVIERYVYTDENGKPLSRVCRTASKKFFQERFESGAFVPGLNGVRRVLYNLPAVLKAKAVLVVEGEKDVETLRSHSLIATTNAGGADAWSDNYAESLKEKSVAIIPDNDEPGRKHAWRVVKSILPIAETVRLVELPGIPEKGDVSDYLKHHTKGELIGLIKAAKPLTAAEVEEKFKSYGNEANESNSYNSSNSYKRAERPKPEVRPDVFQGLAGDIVKAIAPYTESDPVATLANVLAMFGNVVGRNPWFGVERTRHYLNLFFVEVGETSKGRKGTSLSTPKSMMADIDEVWALTRVTGGLSSGEGVVYTVRDERFESKAFREDGEITYKSIRVDEGAPDKRLMLVEEELSQGLKMMSREGNILSAIIRQAWDSGNLHPLTKNSPIRATDAHISIIGHITREELLRYLTETEQANGFANRFIWLMVYRSKKISNPKGVPNDILNPLTGLLRERIDAARKVGEMVRTEKAEETWDGVYPELTEGKPGLIGAVLARGEPQVMRLACVYALMDGKAAVDIAHLNAALALWDYSEQSAMTVFGDLIGDPNVDAAQEGLQAKGALTLTELHALFGRNVSATEVDRVVAVLLKRGLISVEAVTDDRGRKSITMLRWGTNSTNSTNSKG